MGVGLPCPEATLGSHSSAWARTQKCSLPGQGAMGWSPQTREARGSGHRPGTARRDPAGKQGDLGRVHGRMRAELRGWVGLEMRPGVGQWGEGQRCALRGCSRAGVHTSASPQGRQELAGPWHQRTHLTPRGGNLGRARRATRGCRHTAASTPQTCPCKRSGGPEAKGGGRRRAHLFQVGSPGHHTGPSTC